MKYFDDLESLKEFLNMLDEDREKQIQQWYEKKQEMLNQLSKIKLNIAVLNCNIHDARIIKTMGETK